VAWFSPELFDWYFPVALPVAFLAAAAAGWILEATVIRFLYGRLLETLLATWGVSLILMQAARVYFGDLTAVIAPQALRGGAQVMVGVYLPYNRIFIILLSLICVVAIYYLLFQSHLGLRLPSPPGWRGSPAGRSPWWAMWTRGWGRTTSSIPSWSS
jgi:urea transport system permease protein